MRFFLRTSAMMMMAIALMTYGCGDSDDCSTKTEVCDGIDNNCNGLVDDAVTPRPCRTDCGQGTEQCVNGQWTNCNAAEPSVETCNGLDDDCDGCFDEQIGASCDPLEQPCSTDCGQGVEQCYMGQWQSCTAPEPGTEICNDEDDDCDGQTDEDLNIDNDGDGHFSLTSCAQPNDDCNDNNADVYPGHAEGPDYCDGIDNDCNQQIDENCLCSPGPPPETQACSTNIGECTVGDQACQVDGTWGACSGQEPVAETCNQLDDDCDGVTDNVLEIPPCELTLGVCEGVTRTTCAPCNYGADYQAVESRCDLLDNDCDGTTDANLPADNFEHNEECSNPALLSNLEEFDGPATLSKTLYKYELGNPVRDVDWYKITAVEGIHIGCSLDAQEFTVWFYLTLPNGVDETAWQLCVRPDDCSGTEFCSSNWEENDNQYWLGLTWTTLDPPFGGCLFDDNRDWMVSVGPAGGDAVTDCREYTLEMYFVCESNCGG